MPEHDHDHDRDGVPDREEHAHGRSATTERVAVGPSPGGLTLRIVLTLAGAGLMIVSAFLAWLSVQGITVDGTEVPVQALWSTATGTEAEFLTSLGFVAIVLGLVAIVGLAPRTGVLTSLAGALGIVAFILYVITLYRFPGDFGVGDVGIGGWLMLIGAVLALIGGFFGARPVAVVTTTTSAA